MYEALIKRFPNINRERLERLSSIWSREVDAIVDKMIEFSVADGYGVLPLDARPEAIFEFAKLRMWLEEKVLEHKLRGTSVEAIDFEAEESRISSTEGQDKIVNTARNLATHVWNKRQEEWHGKYLKIVTAEPSPKAKKFLKPHGGTKDQHYSPKFANRYWGDDKNIIRIYSRDVQGEIRSKDKGYSAWAQEPFLYSQNLEQYFHLVEGDAAGPYEKLLDTIPLTEHERRCWIAFIITQIFRTPGFASKNIPALAAKIRKDGLEWPTEVEHLRTAYETLFRNNDVFAFFYREMTARQWYMARANVDCLIRSDEPVLVSGSFSDNSWYMMYPMTPQDCFIVGPDLVSDPKQVIPQGIFLTGDQVAQINQQIGETARISVIGKVVNDDQRLRTMLSVHLGKRWPNDLLQQLNLNKYWGSIG